MPFNSNTYHTNKYRRRALETLAKARAVPEWTTRSPEEWRRTYVALARSEWRSYLSFRRIGRMNADARRMHRGQMKPADFIAKWQLKDENQ